MKVSASAFYAYQRAATYRQTKRQIDCAQRVRACFYLHRRRYGTRRLSAALGIGRARVRSAMKRENLRAIQPKRFVPRTTNSTHAGPVSPNLLRNSANEPSEKAKVIVGDITYLPLQNGRFCYLATFQDKYTRRIIGWQVSNRITTQLVIDAFNHARQRRLIKRNAVVHTDRGSQYAALEYRRLLYIHGFRQSMSGKGNCYDNAQAESFFSRFKAELLEGGSFESIEEARCEIFSYIEGYYNRVRLHSALGYKSPVEFEKELKIKEKTNKESLVCGKT